MVSHPLLRHDLTVDVLQDELQPWPVPGGIVIKNHRPSIWPATVRPVTLETMAKAPEIMLHVGTSTWYTRSISLNELL